MAGETKKYSGEPLKLEMPMRILKALHSATAPGDMTSAELEKQRRSQELLGQLAAPMSGLSWEEFSLSGMKAAWMRLERPHRHARCVLYCHGGGYTSGNLGYSRVLASKLVRSTGLDTLSFEYRLAPEHPFPAGLEDCISAYRYLTQQGVRGSDMVFAGDSAGGNLVFALALYLRDHGLELPAGLCTLSPVGALDDSLPSRKERADRDCIIGADFTEEMQITYIGGHDVRAPYLSPIYGDFTGLPPIWMCVGTEEVFYDDAFALQAAAQNKGIPVELLIGKGLCHVYPMFPDRQSKIAVESMRNFIEKRLRVSKS